MEFETKTLALLFLSVLVSGENTCFTFNSKAKEYVLFEVKAFDLYRSTDFNVTFKTNQSTGVIYYVDGFENEVNPYDFEGLFLRDGKLNYLVFNPDATGGGGSFGSHVVTDFTVNNDTWIQVNFFRYKEFQHGTSTTRKSGMYVNDVEFVVPASPFPMNLTSRGITTIFLGGHTDISRPGLDNFDGEMKDFIDLKSNTKLDNPTRAIGKVRGTC